MSLERRLIDGQGCALTFDAFEIAAEAVGIIQTQGPAIGVGIADLYIRLLAMGVIHDPRLLL